MSFDNAFNKVLVFSGGRHGVEGKKPVTPTDGSILELSTVQFSSA